MVVYWATKLRGFLRHISEYSSNVRFTQKDSYYEISGKLHVLKSKLIRSRLLDPIGMFQIISVENKDCDAYGSYNRFLKADRPYFIYLENPTALYHYALGRIKFWAGKRRFRRCLEDPNLKYIVCMSEACRSTFEAINMPLPAHVRMKTIYPLVPTNKYVNEKMIQEKCYNEVLECLYCVQGKRFYTKGGRDVLEAVTNLQDEGYQIHLTVITNVEALDKGTRSLIEQREQISLHEFCFPYEEMEKIYAKTAVLLQPSSDDSCPLTVLEAVKGGCAVLGSRLYAIPEMVRHSENGFLLLPLYESFFSNNMPNPAAWGYSRKKRLSRKRSSKYVNDIKESLRFLCDNRTVLHSFSQRSLEIADTEFGENALCQQWDDVWTVLKGNI